MTQTTITQPETTITEDQEYEISRVDFSCNGIDFQFLTDENGAVHIFGNRTDADCWVWFTVSSCDSLEAAKDYAKYWAEVAPFKPYKGCYIRVWRVAECWICDLIGIDEDLHCAMADTKEDGIRQLNPLWSHWREEFRIGIDHLREYCVSYACYKRGPTHDSLCR